MLVLVFARKLIVLPSTPAMVLVVNAAISLEFACCACVVYQTLSLPATSVIAKPFASRTRVVASSSNRSPAQVLSVKVDFLNVAYWSLKIRVLPIWSLVGGNRIIPDLTLVSTNVMPVAGVGSALPPIQEISTLPSSSSKLPPLVSTTVPVRSPTYDEPPAPPAALEVTRPGA